MPKPKAPLSPVSLTPQEYQRMVRAGATVTTAGEHARKQAKAREPKNGLKLQSEASYQAQVLDTLDRFGWHAFSVRKSSVISAKTGKRISLVTDAGWPDVVAFKGSRKMALELKTDDKRSKPTPEQVDWLAVLEAAGFRTAVLRPMHFERFNWWLNNERAGKYGELLRGKP